MRAAYCLMLAAGMNLIGLRAARAEDEPDLKDLLQLSLEELLDAKIISASNVTERLSEAPAVVIVITRTEIEERGYTELSQIFDDLPSMDVSRPYGSTYTRLLWRDQGFLMMVDGVVFNHLYFGSTETLTAAVPLSNVKQIEFVYGPASSVYGANASMGVINVITLNDDTQEGSYASARLSFGTSEARLADVNYVYKRDALRLSLTARIDHGTLDDRKAGAYEYTKDIYYSDRRLWGGFLDNPNLGGAFASQRRNRAVDVRAFLGNTELAVQHYRLSSGYGLQYAADKVQNNAIWGRNESSLYVRRSGSAGKALSSTTLVRYRRSDISNDSYFVDGYFDSRLGKPVAAMSYWQSLNTSWTAAQDFEARPATPVSFHFGLKYEQKDLNKAYDLSGESSDPNAPGPYLPVDSIDSRTYNYPKPPDAVFRAENRITTEDVGSHLQAWYRRANLWGESDTHQLNAGVRFDHNSQYGNSTTARAGYVGRYGRWGVKLLYGQGFQEPSARLLYGGWKGAGSDPDLKPQRSRAFEGSLSLTSRDASALLDAYHLINKDTFTSVPGTAVNVGQRTVAGFDLHLRMIRRPARATKIEAWAYYSQVLTLEEQKVDATGRFAGVVRIGDVAKTKILFGVTARRGERLSATVRGRWIGDRATTDTNPIRSVASYRTLDANVICRNVVAKGLGLSVQVYNLLDTTYFHPGVGNANAGNTPGAFDAMGVWTGSAGYDNSLLPQPGRAMIVSLTLEL